MKIRPLHDYMVVDRDPAPDTSKGGILIKAIEEGNNTGIITAIGPKVTGTKIGDRVYFSPYLWDSTRVSDDDTLMILNEDQILGVAA